MTRVFLGGSRHASRLNVQVQRRLDNMMGKGLPIVVGDANGADKAFQRYLHDKNYRNVEVYCSAGVCRNNLGGWHMQAVSTKNSARGYEFYSAKDRAMAQAATVGLMLWDGKSVGTILNVLRLLRLRKNVVIYLVPERRFLEFKNLADWEAFFSIQSTALRHKIEERAKLESDSSPVAQQASLFN